MGTKKKKSENKPDTGTEYDADVLLKRTAREQAAGKKHDAEWCAVPHCKNHFPPRKTEIKPEAPLVERTHWQIQYEELRGRVAEASWVFSDSESEPDFAKRASKAARIMGWISGKKGKGAKFPKERAKRMYENLIGPQGFTRGEAVDAVREFFSLASSSACEKALRKAGCRNVPSSSGGKPPTLR